MKTLAAARFLNETSTNQSKQKSAAQVHVRTLTLMTCFCKTTVRMVISPLLLCIIVFSASVISLGNKVYKLYLSLNPFVSFAVYLEGLLNFLWDFT